MIEMQNVDLVYPNGTVGLKNINLTIKDGEFVVIVGLSGAGKSTLIRCINRLVTPTSGKVFVDDENILLYKGQRLRELRTKVGMIFQKHNLVDRSSVLKNVLAGRLGHMGTMRSILNLFKKEDIAFAYENLTRVNIGDKLYNRADELSGGQQQRVSIARVLTQQSSYILADEPIASLDPPTSRQVMDYLRKINKEDRVTVVVNLHFMDIAMEYADRIIGMRDGHIVFDGPIEDVNEKTFEKIYGYRLGKTKREKEEVQHPKLKQSKPNPPTLYKQKIKFQITMITFFIIGFYLLSMYWTQTQMTGDFKNVFINTANLLQKFFPPNIGILSTVWKPMIDTIQMALLSTTVAALLTIPLAILSSRNITTFQPLYVVARLFSNLIRVIPEMVLAIVFVGIFGIGVLSGMIALTIFSIGILSKLMSETIESVHQHSLEAIRASGGGVLQVVCFGLFPLVLPQISSFILYVFEVNVRASVVLGLVGAGGIGLMLERELKFYNYPNVMAIIIVVFIAVICIEYMSAQLREALL